MANLVSLMGGDDDFVARLDATFTPGLHPSGPGAFGKTIFNPGNEPSFGTPFLYNFVNRPDLAVKQSRHIAKSYYKPTRNGLPGNSDAGAMESWLLWVMLGMYPMTGQTTFLLGSPWFSDLTLALGGGRTLRITTRGGGGDAYHVQGVKVNGRDWTKSWVAWDDVFARGGTLEFALGPEPRRWATGARPPSPGGEDGYVAVDGGLIPGVEPLGEVPDPNAGDAPPLRFEEPAVAAAVAGVAAAGLAAVTVWACARTRKARRRRRAAAAAAAAAAVGTGAGAGGADTGSETGSVTGSDGEKTSVAVAEREDIV